MNFNAGPVQNQCHTVQKGHVFTSTFPEVPQNMEVWYWWSQDQRVWTPILNRVNLAMEVNDSGASHSACGVQHAAGRKKGNKQEWKNITRCCWTPNQWGRDILYIFINWIQFNFLYIAPNHKHRLRQEYPSLGTSNKVITDVSLKYKEIYLHAVAFTTVQRATARNLQCSSVRTGETRAGFQIWAQHCTVFMQTTWNEGLV